MMKQKRIAEFLTLVIGTIALTAALAQAGGTILSSEDWEGATNSTDFGNTVYDPTLDTTIDLNGTGLNTTKTGFFRSSNRTWTLKAPLPLASGGYTNVTVEHEFYYDFSSATLGVQVEYSALGDFSDTQVVKRWVVDDYTMNEWHSGNAALDPGTYSFTDTAKIRWRSGGYANRTHSWQDNIVITGYRPPAGMVLIIR